MENALLHTLADDYFEKFSQELKILSVAALGGGCINRALFLVTNKGKLFLKWNSSGNADLFLREYESLLELNKADNEFIVFPKPLLAKTIDSTPGYLLTTFLEKGTLGNDDEKLGRGIAQMHKAQNNQYGFGHNNYCGATLQNNSYTSSWIDFYANNRILYIVNQIAKNKQWSSENRKTAESFIAKVPHLLNYKTSPALIHGDLWSGNYMYTAKGPALIDPCVCYCDREFEFGIMTMFGGFSQKVFDAYNEYYPLMPGWKDRNLIYQLYHVLNHYLLFGGFYKQQALDIMKRYI